MTYIKKNEETGYWEAWVNNEFQGEYVEQDDAKECMMNVLYQRYAFADKLNISEAEAIRYHIQFLLFSLMQPAEIAKELHEAYGFSQENSSLVILLTMRDLGLITVE